MRLLSELFDDEPQQWGLRGDPYLWREMAQKLGNTAIPSSKEELTQLVQAAFQRLTGYPMEYTSIIKLPKYDHGGISGGGISTEFWREKALPLLTSRLDQLNR